MEVPSKKMEEIYSIPVKYIESWLELEESGRFKNYWVVLKTHYMFFFQDQNTHCKETYVGYFNIEVGETKITSKNGNKDKRCDFLVEIFKKKKFLLRASDDILRKRWIYALELVAKAEPPGPLPGDPDFKMPTVFTPGPAQMKPRRSVIEIDDSTNKGEGITIDEDREEPYDSVFIPPSWYLSNLSREEASQLLNNQKIGTYLLRNAESRKAPGHFTLSIKDVVRIKNHKIYPTKNGCYFEGAANRPFENPFDAVSYLMKTKYLMLNPVPTKVPYPEPTKMPNPEPNKSEEVRSSGDGEEEEGEEGDVIKKESEYHTSPVTPSFGGYLPFRSRDESNSKNSTSLLPIPPEPPKKQGEPALPSPPESVRPRTVSSKPLPPRKVQTLPNLFRGSMKDRPLPKLPLYENIAQYRNGFPDESYVDMKQNFNNNVDDDEDTPPPLPRKKSLPHRIPQEPIYVNQLFHENEARNLYEIPVECLNELQKERRRSQP